jgi:outer membrane protein insertion porin family
LRDFVAWQKVHKLPRWGIPLKVVASVLTKLTLMLPLYSLVLIFLLLIFSLHSGVFRTFAAAAPVEPEGYATSQRALIPADSPSTERKIPTGMEDTPSSAELKASHFYGRSIKSVVLTGNDRSRSSYLLRVLTVEPGERLAQGMTERSFKNLQNTKNMKHIRFEFEPRGQEEVTVVIVLEELWTTIPFLVFSSGGGSVLILGGVVETNMFGYGAQAWLTYQYLDGTNSWSGEMQYPDFLQTTLRLVPYFSLELKNNEIRSFDSSKELQGGFSSDQKTFGIFVRRPVDTGVPFLSVVNPGVGVRYSRWSFSEKYLSLEAKDSNKRNEFLLPDMTRRIYYSGETELGRVDYNEYQADGALLLYRYTIGVPFRSTAHTFQEHFMAGKYFLSIGSEAQLASRFEWQRRQSNNIGDEEMMGGLFHVRGLPNDIFRGRNLWFYNVEMRLMMLRQQYVNWQGVTFTDGGDTSSTLLGIENVRKPRGSAVSAGFGIRAMFPDISQLTLRADYGWLFLPFRTSGLSLGVVQFIR